MIVRCNVGKCRCHHGAGKRTANAKSEQVCVALAGRDTYVTKVYRETMAVMAHFARKDQLRGFRES